MRQPHHEKPRMIAGSERGKFFAFPKTRKSSKYPHILDVKFDKETNPLEFPDGHWMFQGAVSWPIVVPDEGLVGIAVLGGYHLETKTLWFMSERKFIVVEGGGNYPVDAPRPLKSWFEAVYDAFACRRYYHLQVRGKGKQAPKASTKKFTSQINRLISKPNPSMIGLQMDFHVGMQTFYEYVALNRLMVPSETRLWSEMQAYDADPEGSYPALHSACVLLNGLDKRLNREYLITKVLSDFPENSP